MLVLLIGLLIGLVLGLTGAGGSVLALPLLTGALNLPLGTAVMLSLLAVTLAASLGVIGRLRSGDILVRPALVMMLSGVLLAPLGAWLREQLPEAWVLGGFALVVILVAIRLWRQIQQSPDELREVRAPATLPLTSNGSSNGLTLTGNRLNDVKLAFGGVLTGVLSGLFGVGGGFVIVPVLRLVLHLPMRKAVATSLLVIAAVSGGGFVVNLLHHISPLSPLGLWLAAGAAVGMWSGTWIGRRIAGPGLQRVFVVLMLVVSAWSLWQAGVSH